ncbi:flagellar hook-basal body complex protein FliE [Saccharothrix violaceirubra]|uniref:Flagellar hook-basal body complex protein FliE n=1 Tax=Saccharothrix violaceirubra TaxID=413306 RepID=A0A7W7WYB3_9PSEU|nr:flagellar hook-basal body complex protein FliE [Saccharothrix violaceirubra]MBB4968359.1 flagellar hook-basal body complex protein FliE [Saccharothrix violaceirubra]
MSSPISAIGAVSAPIAPISLSGATSADYAEKSSFGDMIGAALAKTEQAQSKASDLAVQLSTGDLDDPQEYLMAATEASLSTQLTVAIRNKAVDAFNEIMRLQA